ncbi:uncharacterized protein [Physcomitrium patens]|uniref:Methyltransferase domain-containing protein n=1 Tax=Physcomitrium patens TaxID=3218 RepID=A0A2K1L945_PHYPA|nr:hypothetical protein PHYPA_000967 [Physcomitrium patens]
MVVSMYSAAQDVSDVKLHVTAIATFLRRFEWLWRSHVVDFFKAELWGKVDKEWIACLRLASAESWLLMPSGIVQEGWPESLKEFVRTAGQLSLSRGQVDVASNMSFPGTPQAPIGSVLAQGMSVKKRHEIGILAAVIAGTAELSGSKDVIDVGAGQGYLALVLAFEYRLSVTAVDACAHHADVTNKRAQRIEKYYNTRLRKSQQAVRAPQTVTCRVGTGEFSAALSSLLPAFEESKLSEVFANERPADHDENTFADSKNCSVVLAGLHACGDLSATMLRTFIECKEVTAVINVACCYHLLTEESSNDKKEFYGFPMSEGVSNLGLELGRSARELACESPDRWKEHHPTRAIQNFELHAFRAAFQLILDRYYPETADNRPSVGRVGKSRRRRKARQAAMEPLPDNSGNGTIQSNIRETMLECENRTETSDHPLGTSTLSTIPKLDVLPGSAQDGNTLRFEHVETSCSINFGADPCELVENVGDLNPSSTINAEFAVEQQAARFEDYAKPVLELLDLPPLSSSVFRCIWSEVAAHQDLVGPFYSLRTVLAPVIESYILLDRLLYVKERAEILASKDEMSCQITSQLVPLFEPSTSPRNMAIIARRGEL